MYGWRYLTDEIIIIGFHQVLGRVKEWHCAVNANTHVYAIFLSTIYDMLHILKRVPRRKTKHQGNRNNIPTRLYNFDNLIISIPATHIEIGFSGAVKWNIQMLGVMIFYSRYYLVYRKTIRQQRIVRMMSVKPSQYLVCFGMKDKLTSLQADRRTFRYTFAVHYLDDVV